MTINFPPPPLTVGQLHPDPAVAGLPQYKWDGTVWVTNTPQEALSYVRRSGDTMTGALVLPADPTAALQSATKQYVDSRDNIRDVRRNRVVNGAMQVSQEWGNTLLSVVNSYPADQWRISFATTGVINFQRIQTVTPNTNLEKLAVIINTADVSLAATEHLQIMQDIEANLTNDFQWGTASAEQVILRFGFRTTAAGVYSISVINAASDRSYVANFTITAGQVNTDTVQTFVIPGDTTGSWPFGTVLLGMTIRVVLAAGSNFLGVTGWQAGFRLGTASNTNGMATVNSQFNLFDVGLYLDPDNTGIAPKWEMPNPAQELIACKRYYQAYASYALFFSGNVTAGNNYFASNQFFPSMRTSPTTTTVRVSEAGFGTGAAIVYTSSAFEVTVYRAATSSGVGWYIDQCYANARM